MSTAVMHKPTCSWRPSTTATLYLASAASLAAFSAAFSCSRTQVSPGVLPWKMTYLRA